ncbi:Uncharacterized protein Fot_16612 [Forsythia ovata]|uniref:Uncharacterized protein n=1 Tax=Forsythia ovata TaxID=205694 RepID=A0ABD1VDC3_9LAMI
MEGIFSFGTTGIDMMGIGRMGFQRKMGFLHGLMGAASTAGRQVEEVKPGQTSGEVKKMDQYGCRANSTTMVVEEKNRNHRSELDMSSTFVAAAISSIFSKRVAFELAEAQRHASIYGLKATEAAYCGPVRFTRLRIFLE